MACPTVKTKSDDNNVLSTVPLSPASVICDMCLFAERCDPEFRNGAKLPIYYLLIVFY